MHETWSVRRCRVVLGLVVPGLLPALAGAVDLDQQLGVCAACHATGAGGAPKIGRPAEWAPRLDKGMPALLRSVREGVPGTLMAPGICRDCSDEEVETLIRRMSAPPKP